MISVCQVSVIRCIRRQYLGSAFARTNSINTLLPGAEVFQLRLEFRPFGKIFFFILLLMILTGFSSYQFLLH